MFSRMFSPIMNFHFGWSEFLLNEKLSLVTLHLFAGEDEGSFCPDMPPTPPAQICGPNDFTCGNGDCISISKVCNGFRDCLFGEDEGHFCNPPLPLPPPEPICPPHQFVCQSDQSCIDYECLCNNVRDCPRGW